MLFSTTLLISFALSNPLTFSAYTTFVLSPTLGNVKSYSKVPSTISVVISYATSEAASVALTCSSVRYTVLIVRVLDTSGKFEKVTVTSELFGYTYTSPTTTGEEVVADTPEVTQVGFAISSGSEIPSSRISPCVSVTTDSVEAASCTGVRDSIAKRG